MGAQGFLARLDQWLFLKFRLGSYCDQVPDVRNKPLWLLLIYKPCVLPYGRIQLCLDLKQVVTEAHSDQYPSLGFLMQLRCSVSPARSFSKGSHIVIYNKRFVAIFVGKFDSPYTYYSQKMGGSKQWQTKDKLVLDIARNSTASQVILPHLVPVI